MHEHAADAGALLGAVGAVLVLVPRARAALVGGLVLLVAAEALLAYALVPGHDLGELAGSSARVAALVLVGAALVVGAILLDRRPSAAPIALLVAAPFRVPVHVGDQKASLLLPLYAVLVAGTAALLARALRGVAPPRIAPVIAVPAASFIALSGASLLWTDDLRAGTIELVFFLFPFAALVAVVARAPIAGMPGRAAGTALVALGCVFAAVGLSQLWTGDLYFARDLEVANAYTTFFRTTSLFADSSIYGRELALAIVVVVSALYLRRVRLGAACALLAFLWAGLFFTYSQSSMVALVVAALTVGLLAADRGGRRLLAGGAVACVAVAALGVGLTARGDSAQRATSGRTFLVQSTWDVFVDHPLAGVGVGSQPQAARDAGGKRSKARNASHTTPLTVAAELGVLGILAYLAFLAGAALALVGALRRRPALGLGMLGCFVLLLVHSVFYSGFFEDPLTWGLVALAAALMEVEHRPTGLPFGAVAPGSARAGTGVAARLRRRWQA